LSLQTWNLLLTLEIIFILKLLLFENTRVNVLDSITTLLPCDESDFAFGIIPTERAALPGTRAAMANPSFTSVKSQSLFVSVSIPEAIFIVLLSLKHFLKIQRLRSISHISAYLLLLVNLRTDFVGADTNP
jgi:hypothetical protein